MKEIVVRDAKAVDIDATAAQPDLVTAFEKESRELVAAGEETAGELQVYYQRIVEEKGVELEQDVQAELASLRRAEKNIGKAYQDVVEMVDELNARWRDVESSRKRRLIPAPPANAVIDVEEAELHHFARGVNFYKLSLVLLVGSLLGVIIEMLWCLLRNGYIESRSALVWGPLNPVYGAGALVLSATLYKYRNRGPLLSFLGGMVVGSVVEYLCSWAQETLFGSTSWDYSQLPFNINGRICLLYSFFWGILGVLWVKNIYPRLAALILKIPNTAGKVFTWVALVFLVIDCVVSLIAVYRWAQRIGDISAANAFWEFIDRRFPDTRMRHIYSNMHFGS